MHRLATITALTAAALIGTAASADPAAGEDQPEPAAETQVETQAETEAPAYEDAPAYKGQPGHWEYRTFRCPVYGYNQAGDYTVMELCYETKRVWIGYD